MAAMKKGLSVALLVLLVLSVSACRHQNGSASVDEARAAFEKMCTELLEYTKAADGESVDKYVACYPEGWDEGTIMGCFYDDYIENGFPDFAYYAVPLDDKGEYYIGGIINYAVEDSGVRKSHWPLTISFTDGNCRIDCSDKVAAMAAGARVFPDEMGSAAKAGRYYGDFSNGDRSFADPAAVIKGVYQMNIYCMWQNEDGSLSIGLSVKNGTDEEKNTGIIYVTVTRSDGTGAIVEGYELRTDTTLAGNTSANIILNIPGEDLALGFDADDELFSFVQYTP